MEIPVFVPGVRIKDDGTVEIDADEMNAAGVPSVEFIEEPATEAGSNKSKCDICQDSGWIVLTGADTVHAVCPFCNKDGRRVSVDAKLAAESATEVGSGDCGQAEGPQSQKPFNASARIEELQAKVVEARKAEGAWIVAALNRYPPNWAFDATNPELVIANIVAGVAALQVNARIAELEAKLADETKRWLTAVDERIEAKARITELEAQLASATRNHEQFARDIAHKLDIPYTPPVSKGQCEYLQALEMLKEQLAEAKRLWEVADDERVTARAQLKEIQANWKKVEPIVGRMEKAEADAARLSAALVKVEAYMASEEGPICRLWENCDIGDYDDYQTEWEQTLFDVRDWKNGCVPAASLGGGTEWPEILLYREVLSALAPESTAPTQKGESE